MSALVRHCPLREKHVIGSRATVNCDLVLFVPAMNSELRALISTRMDLPTSPSPKVPTSSPPTSARVVPRATPVDPPASNPDGDDASDSILEASPAAAPLEGTTRPASQVLKRPASGKPAVKKRPAASTADHAETAQGLEATKHPNENEQDEKNDEQDEKHDEKEPDEATATRLPVRKARKAQKKPAASLGDGDDHGGVPSVTNKDTEPGTSSGAVNEKVLSNTNGWKALGLMKKPFWFLESFESGLAACPEGCGKTSPEWSSEGPCVQSVYSAFFRPEILQQEAGNRTWV